MESVYGVGCATPLKDVLSPKSQGSSIEERAAAAAVEDANFQQALKRSLGETEGNDESLLSMRASSPPPETDDMEEDKDTTMCQSGDLVQHGDEQWTCLPCTDINESSSATCDMCMSVRPRPKVKILTLFLPFHISQLLDNVFLLNCCVTLCFSLLL